MKFQHFLLTTILTFGVSGVIHAGAPATVSATAATPDQPGAYAVGHLTSHATDKSRSRTLRYDIWYPANATAAAAGPVTNYELDDYFFLGRSVPFPSALAREGVAADASGAFPLIVYSHSRGGTRFEAYDLCELLASRGYVIISADHTGSGWIGDMNPMGDEEDPIRDFSPRALDCRFLIDTALSRNSKKGDLLRDRIDPKHIGGTGWSYGGAAVAALAGGYHGSKPDTRVDALVLLSPSTWAFTPEDLGRIRGSVLTLTGTNDGTRWETTDAYARFGGPRALVSLLGADHSSFDVDHDSVEWIRTHITDEDVLSFLPPPDAEQLAKDRAWRAATLLYTSASFDLNLKGDASAAAWLTPAYAAANLPAVASVRSISQADLNGNGIPDSMDIANGTSLDRNRNKVPDEVENRVIRVRAGAAAGGDGTTWARPLNTLTRALQLARASQGRVKEIWVAAGTYTPQPDPASGDSCFLVRNVEVYGGFAGTESKRDQRDPAAHPTILSGDLAGDDLPGFLNRDDNAVNVVTIFRSDKPTAVDGFTIRGAFGPSEYGGGIFLSGGEVRNCLITDNYAYEGGGAMTINTDPWYSETVISDCVFKGNASLGGGGISVTQGRTYLVRCRFEENSALGDADMGAGWGGALYSHENGHPKVLNCEFIRNTANLGGALISADYGDPGTLEVVNSLLRHNTAADLSGAEADNQGAGGAVVVQAAQKARLTNVTAVENTSTLPAWDTTGSLVIQNSIVLDGSDWITGTPVVSYSYIQGGFTGVDNVTGAPLFVNAAAGDYRQLKGSPGVNAGKTKLTPRDLSPGNGHGRPANRDLDGRPRVDGKSVDIGAYEK